jgi:hypothetical protein
MAESEKVVRRTRATTRHSALEEEIRIVPGGLRGQVPISELSRGEGISGASIGRGPGIFWRQARTA